MAYKDTIANWFKVYSPDTAVIDLGTAQRTLPFYIFPVITAAVGALMVLASMFMPAFFSPELSVTSGNMVVQYIPAVTLIGLVASAASVTLYMIRGSLLSPIIAMFFGFACFCFTVIYSYSGQFVNLLHVNVVTHAAIGLWVNGIGDLVIAVSGFLMTLRADRIVDEVKQEITVWATAFILQLGLARHVAFFFAGDLARSIQASQGVLNGYPHWRHFQSRLLGPWLAKALTVAGGVSFSTAHVIIAVTILTITSVVMFHAGRIVAGRQGGWSALLAFQTLYVLMMSRPWLYVWDYFILLTGAVFLLLVVSRAPWWAFLALMGVAYFNHETAAFIGVWMVVQSLADAWAGHRRPDWKMLGAGIIGALAGQVLIEILRRTLLKREIGWLIFPDMAKVPTSPLDAYFHVQVSANINDISQWMAEPDRFLMFLIPLTLIVALTLAAVLVLRHGMKAAGLAAYAVVQIAALLAFGLRSETRNLLQLVPFLCLGGMLAARRDWDATVADPEYLLPIEHYDAPQP